MTAAIAPPTTRITEIAVGSLLNVLRYLGIEREICRSSDRRYGNETLRGQDRILDICKREHADVYINLPGGRDLYDKRAFADAGIELRFLEPRLDPYPQTSADFVSALSILDVLMHLPIADARARVLSADFAPT